MNVKNIFNGWWNLLKQKTVGHQECIEQQVKYRESICTNCKVNKSNICSNTREDFHIYTGEKVSGCNCPLAAKVNSYSDTCPLGKWFEMKNENDWVNLQAISNCDKLIYKNQLIINNKQKKFYSNVNGSLILPYIHINPVNLKKFIILNVKEYLIYNERTFILNFKEELKNKIEELWSEVIPDYNTDMILWIVNDFDMNETKLRNCTERYINQFDSKKIKFCYTKSDNKEELNKLMMTTNYFFYGSKIIE
jgi:hypothetical protein